MFLRKKYKLSKVGVCSFCLKLNSKYLDSENTELDEYYKNLFSDCGSEAIDIAFTSLSKFMEENSLEDLKNRRRKISDSKDKLRPKFWRSLNRRISRLIELKTEIAEKGSDTIMIKL